MARSKVTPKSKTSLAIVARVVKFQNLDDEGKIESFFLRTRKKLESEIVAYERNIDTEKFNLKNKKAQLTDKLEDVIEEYQNAFLNVEVSKISTNMDQSAYMDKYIHQIGQKSFNIDILQSELKKVEEESLEVITNYQKEIDFRNHILAALV